MGDLVNCPTGQPIGLGSRCDVPVLGSTHGSHCTRGKYPIRMLACTEPASLEWEPRLSRQKSGAKALGFVLGIERVSPAHPGE